MMQRCRRRELPDHVVFVTADYDRCVGLCHQIEFHRPHLFGRLGVRLAAAQYGFSLHAKKMQVYGVEEDARAGGGAPCMIDDL